MTTAASPRLTTVPRFDELPDFKSAWTSSLVDGEWDGGDLPSPMCPRALEPNNDPEWVELWTELSGLDNDQLMALPRPIIHRGTRMIIDGALIFRVLDARLSTVPVRWFDGTEDEAVVMAMGLDQQAPRRRSREDKLAAARLWMIHHPETSNESIARTFRLRKQRVVDLRVVVEKEKSADGTPTIPPLKKPGQASERAAGYLRANTEDLDTPDIDLAKMLGVDRAVIRKAKSTVRDEITAKEQREKVSAPPSQEDGSTGDHVLDPALFDGVDVTGQVVEFRQELFQALIDACSAVLNHYESLTKEEQSEWLLCVPDSIFEQAYSYNVRVNRLMLHERTGRQRQSA